MKQLQGFIFDLDGTVYLSDRLIEGAKETISLLRKEGKKLLFLTNYPLETRMDKVNKLNQLGIPVEMEEVLNSSYVLAHYLTTIHKKARILPIAESVVTEELQKKGHIITENQQNVDYVVVSWDRGFNYEKLNQALQAVRNGAKMIATNPDRTCPVEGGVVPDAAGMIGAIEGVTGKKIDLIAGKPSMIMAKAAMDIIGLEASECIMIGDRLETDILMGQQAGMKTALVLTGVSTKDDITKQGIAPDYQLHSIADIPRYLL
jgi:arabinose operon protein AraL